VRMVRYCARANFPAINTLKRRLQAAWSPPQKDGREMWQQSAGRESTPTRARRRGGESRGEETVFRIALVRSKGLDSERSENGKPQERCGESSAVSRGISIGEPSMRSGGETVERVRNPEDGRFRAVVEATGIDGRQASSSAEGERNPRRGAPALRVRLRL